MGGNGWAPNGREGFKMTAGEVLLLGFGFYLVYGIVKAFERPAYNESMDEERSRRTREAWRDVLVALVVIVLSLALKNS